jgi:hypothetical protein
MECKVFKIVDRKTYKDADLMSTWLMMGDDIPREHMSCYPVQFLVGQDGVIYLQEECLQAFPCSELDWKFEGNAWSPTSWKAEDYITDDFGNYWINKCPDCGGPMQIIRPGDCRCQNECWLTDEQRAVSGLA